MTFQPFPRAVAAARDGLYVLTSANKKFCGGRGQSLAP
jgi:hypothetical protein